MIDALVLPRFDLPRAARALGALLKDPDDLPQVFTLIESVSGTAPHRLLFRLRRTESGKRLLRDKPDIMPVLADRAALRALPEGSLGRAYLAFVESEGITPEGASELARARGLKPPPAFAFLNMRMRDTHDLGTPPRATRATCSARRLSWPSRSPRTGTRALPSSSPPRSSRDSAASRPR